MSDTVSAKWLPMAEAAAVMGCSTRTISRYIKQGRLETRVGPDGRKAVLVDGGQMADSGSQCPPPDSGETVSDSGRQVADSVSAIVRVGDLVRDLETKAASELQRTRRAAAGWAVLAVALLIVAATVGPFMAGAMSRHATEAEGAKAQATDLAGRVDELRADLVEQRKQHQADRDQAAAQLAAIGGQLADRSAEAARLAQERDRLADRVSATEAAKGELQVTMEALKAKLAATEEQRQNSGAAPDKQGNNTEAPSVQNTKENTVPATAAAGGP